MSWDLYGSWKCGDWHVAGACIDATPMVLVGVVPKYSIVDSGGDGL